MIGLLSVASLATLLTVQILCLVLTACGAGSLPPGPDGPGETPGAELLFEHVGDDVIRFTALFDADVLEFSKERGVDKVSCPSSMTIKQGRRSRPLPPAKAPHCCRRCTTVSPCPTGSGRRSSLSCVTKATTCGDGMTCCP